MTGLSFYFLVVGYSTESFIVRAMIIMDDYVKSYGYGLGFVFTYLARYL